MSLIKTESFDAISAPAQRSFGSGGSISTTAKRTGRASWYNGGGASVLTYAAPVAEQHATVILGLAMNREALSTMTTYIAINGDGINHVTLQINNDGSALLRLGYTGGSAIPGATAPAGTFASGTWEHVQIKATCHDTTGNVQVRVNANPVPVINYTGDTRSGGASGTYNGYTILSAGSGSPQLYVDDLYLCNGAGSVNNDFLGDLQIHALLPNAEGDVIQFTPSTSTVHWSLVDEAPSVTTDYNTGTTDGHRDLLNFANLVPTSGTIVGITRSTYAAKVGGEVKYQRDVLRIASTDYEGASKIQSTTAAYFDTIYQQNPVPPGTAAWTIADVNALQAGSVVKDT